MNNEQVKVGDIIPAQTCLDCDGSGKCSCSACKFHTWGFKVWMWGKCPVCHGSGIEGPQEVIYVRDGAVMTKLED
jgi:hypothetical protein